MSTPHETTPGYDGGWFNGNPRLMIVAGSYAQYRERLKGFTPEQMAEFDAMEVEAAKTRIKKVSKPKAKSVPKPKTAKASKADAKKDDSKSK